MTAQRKKSLGLSLLIVITLFALSLFVHNVAQSSSMIARDGWDLSQQYQIGKIKHIDGIEKNLSGITYQPESGHLFAVSNNPSQLFELSRQGDIIRTITLEGFVDTESIDYLGNNQFVVAEERRNQLVMFDLDANTQVIHHQDSKRLPLAEQGDNNRGLEGVVWSRKYGFFTLKEEPPALGHHVLSDGDALIDPQQLNHELPLAVKDFAGISLFQQNDEEFLLVLSEASHNLSLITMQGKTLSSLPLTHRYLSFWPLFEQPEGVAVDDEGNIYIVGEPNQFMTMKRIRS